MENSKIIFAGDNHGGIVALKSIQQHFDVIEVMTTDKNIISLLRPTDTLITNFLDSNTKLVVCAGYHSIVTEEVLNKKIIINTHPSLLPKYRGMHGLAWGMLNFEEELGFTIHLMNKYIDDGDVLEQFTVRYTNQTSQEIMEMFDNYVEQNLGRVVSQFLTKEIVPRKQDRSKATWVAKRNLNDCIVDFNKDNKYIERLFKVLVSPYPLPMIDINDKLFEIISYKLLEIKYETHIGRVLNIEDNDVYIKVKDGLLIINKLREYKTGKPVLASKLLKIGKRL